MKNKIFNLKPFLMIVAILIAAGRVNAQVPTYELEIKNDQVVSSTVYEFDIWIKSTGADFPLRTFQGGLLISKSFVNGPASVSLVSGSSQLIQPNVSFQYVNSGISSGPGSGPDDAFINIGPANNACPGTNISSSPLRIGRFRITRSGTGNFGCSPANLLFYTGNDLASPTRFGTKLTYWVSCGFPSTNITIPQSNGNHLVNLNNQTAVITADPQSQSACIGGTVTFSVTANSVNPGSPAITYQWRENGNDLSGETGSSLTLSGLTAGMNGNQYDVVVTQCGSVTSNAAILSVTDNLAPVPVLVSLPNATGECSVTVTPPTATDNCAGTITGTTTDPLTYTVQGTYTITWTYNDGNGNTSSQSQTVIVDDVTAPVADVASLPNATGECSVTVSAPTATDNCSGTITGTTTDPLTYSAQGTYTITWTYNDGNGNTSSQSQTVIVDDVTAPVADVALLPNATGECSVTVSAPTATDNCVGVVTGTTTDPLTYTVQGTYTITWTYNDGNGNTSSQSQTVIVDDVTAPVADVALLPNATGECSVTVTPPTATDNCVGVITGTTTDPLTYSAQGTYTITWTYNDGNGNTSSQSQTVIVDDVTAPVADVALLPNATGECSVTVTAPTATDNCVGVVTGTTTDPLTYNTQGTYTITWTYNDGNGNTSSQSQTVIVDDVTAPVADVALLPNATGECSVTVSAPTATDNCVGVVTATTTDPLTYTVQGTYTITWTYNDGNGNTSSQSQTVIVDDVTAPVADVPSLPNATGECSVTVTAPTATDNCVGTITGTTTDPLTYTVQGTYTITWTYNDGNGNTSSQSQTVIVDDVTAPVADVALLPNATGECSVTVTPPTATDNCVGVVTGTTTDPLTYTVQGTYTITWTYNDGNGNTSSQSQTVIVDDVTAPVADVALLPNATGECSVTVTPPTATDNCSGTITGTTTDPLTYSAQGTYTITWTYNDGNGNTSSQSQTVIVDDVTAPVADVALLPNATGECSVTVTAPTATDNCSGTITGTTTDPLTYSAQGTYTITWTYNDGNGNTSSQSQTVIVDDVTAPVADIALLPNATGECSVTVTAPTATDNCVGVVTGTTTDPLTYSAQGTYTITWTYNDGNGNTSLQSQTVIVDDVTAPVADVALLPNATGECSVTVTAPTATDNCSGTITGTTTDPLTYNAQGTYTITWTYNDGNGNTSSQSQTVIVDDVTAPVADIALLPNATGECSVTVTPPTATDNCVGVVTGTTTDPLTYSAQGTYTITWTYNDGNGNTSSQSQTVIVDDVTAPVADVALLPNATGECSVTVSAPTATDNCSGTITGTTTDPLTYSVQGTYSITWTYNDGNGNTSSQLQTVIVDDVTAPVADVALLPNASGECSVTVTAPIATDNCVGVVTATTTDPLTYSAQGTYTITWTYNDGNGNTSSQSQTVIVDDVTAPVADVPSLPNATGECSVTVTPPTATDNCVGVVTATTTDPLTYTVQGTYTITWTYNDGNGNTSSQSQTVIVDDITAPVADVALLPNATGECSVTVTAPTATDNCSGTITGTTTDPLTYTVQGTYTITWTYIDGNGNTSYQSQTVIVDDVTAPVADVALLPNATGECSVTVTPPTATDNCVGVVTGTTTDPLTYTAQGTYTITWTYNDGNGNTSSQSQTVIVDDVTAPVADVPSLPNATGECSVTVTAPTATDNCVGVVTGTTTDPLTYTAQGTYTITWTYNDGNGNTSSQSQTVIVDDVTAPVADVALLPNATGECSVTVTAPTATDNCSGTITGTTTDPLTYTVQGTYTITWTYNDGNGNTSSQSQTVIVDDVTAPVADVALLPNATGECSVTVTPPTATDNCVGVVTGTTTDPLTYPAQGTYTITWTYNDGNGNTSSQSQTVIVDDVTAPVADVPSLPNATGECSVTISAPTATDNCSGTITGTTTDPLTYTVQGTYSITWTYNDGNGNTSSQSQTVIVDDVTAPVIHDCPANIVQCNPVVTWTAPTATDNCAIGSFGSTHPNGSTFPPGSTTVTYAASDVNGNISFCSFTVTITSPSTWYADSDNDLYGNPMSSVNACTQPSGYVADNTDCNDADNTVYPGATELCDNLDNDCDGLTDEGLTLFTYYADADLDTYGSNTVFITSCNVSAPSGYTSVTGDCNDSDPAINPAASESCNNIDDDCDGMTDEGLPGIIYYTDNDNDGYGTSSFIVSCHLTPPAGYSLQTGDCDDMNASVNPGMTEICNGIDDDCDLSVDEGIPVNIYYADNDNDTYGNTSVSITSCQQPAGYVLLNGDCNDGNAAVNPGATEICNGIDDDCDGSIDDGNPISTYFADNDNDTYGDPMNSITACIPPSGYVSDNTDCDDGNPMINPAAAEICNGIDDDCDGTADDGVTPVAGSIIGSASQCVPFSSGSTSFSVPAVSGATGYSWSVPPGMFVVSGQGTNNVVIGWTSVAVHDGLTGQICMDASNACGSGPASCIALDINIVAPVTPGSISGPNKVCPGDNVIYSISNVARAATYTWTVPAGMTITGGQGTNIMYATVNPGYTGGAVTVNANNSCGSSPARSKSLGLNIPAAPPSIAGPVNGLCGLSGVVYTTPGSPVATSYIWSVPSGATIISGQGTTSITVDFTLSFTSGQITVAGINTCGTGAARSVTLIGAPGQPGIISGPTAICPSQTGVIYQVNTVPGASIYTWTVPGGAVITSGQGTKIITVDYGANPATNQIISVKASNACGTGLTRVLSGITISFDNCPPRLGDNSSEVSEIIIWPNPANQILNFSFESEADYKGNWKIMDVSGRLILDGSFISSNGINTRQIILDQLTSGVYFLEVEVNGIKQVKRFMTE